MFKLKKSKFLIIMLFISAIILSACGNRMFNKAVDQGKLAVASMEYEKAKASFELALEEKEDHEVKAMLEQVNDMVAGLKAKENDEIEEAIKYFRKITKGDSIFPSMAEQADKIGQELQKVQERINHYEDQVLQAESFIKEKQYAEGKELLNQLIEETKDQKVLILVHERAQGALEQIHKEVAQIEEQRKEEKRKQEQEIARQAEIEKQKRMISNAELMDILVQGSDRLQESMEDGRDFDGQIQIDGSDYTPYISRFNTYEKIENYLSPYFSKSAIKNHLEPHIIEKGGEIYTFLRESATFAMYDEAVVIERIENENTIHAKVSIYLDGRFYSTTKVTYVYENDKWLINSKLEDWGTSIGFYD